MRQYDSLGNVEEGDGKVHPKKLVMIRMQVDRVRGCDGETLGAVIFAQSFLMIDSVNFVCITNHVPNFLNWYTNNKHFMNMPIPIQTEHNLECDLLGDKVLKDFHSTLLGL